MIYTVFSLALKAFRNLFGVNSSFSFPDFLINTPSRSSLLAQYLSKHPQLAQHFKPIYRQDDESSILVAHDLLPSGVKHVLSQKKLPIAVYECAQDFELFLKSAVPAEQHVAIVQASCVSGLLEDDSTHYYAVVYEATDGEKKLYAYDPYRHPSISASMQAMLAQHEIKLYYADTPRSYALKGTSFAYAIHDAEKLRGAPRCYEIAPAKTSAQSSHFKLEPLFRYNGLEAKRDCFQLLIDADAQACTHASPEITSEVRRGCYDYS